MSLLTGSAEAASLPPPTKTPAGSETSTSPAAMIMPRAGMILVEVFVRSPEGTMIGAVLPSARETLVVRTFMGSVDSPMQLPVLRMVACVFVEVVVAFVRRGRRGSCGQHQRRGRDYGFRHGHGGVSDTGLFKPTHKNHTVSE